MKHTPEPWRVQTDGPCHASIEAGTYTVIPSLRDAIHDMDRIVASVNACAGMEDPKSWIDKLEETVTALKSNNLKLKNILLNLQQSLHDRGEHDLQDMITESIEDI